MYSVFCDRGLKLFTTSFIQILLFCLGLAARSPLYAQTTVTIQSASPVHVADYKNGDNVTIEASISTSDPTEAPEGESLVI